MTVPGQRLLVVMAAAALLFVPAVAHSGAEARSPNSPDVPAQGGWVCDAYDQSAKRGRSPEADANGHTFPILTVHGITGSDEDFDGIVDQSYNGANPQPPRSLLDAVAGIDGQEIPSGLPHAHVYSFSYTPDSLRWIDHPEITGRLGATIDCLHDLHGVPVSVVAHSMGGLATRHVANSTDPTGLPRSTKLGQVVTLGTPYLGSDLAAIAGRALDVTGAISPHLKLLNYLCGQSGSASGEGSCLGIPLVGALNSEAGRALRTGSPELAELDLWPTLNTVAIAGRNTLRATLFGAPLTDYDLGDLVVPTASATADAARNHQVTCAYDFVEAGGPLDELRKLWNGGETPEERKAQLANFFTSRPCYHSTLMRNVEVTNEVLGTLNDWLAANAVQRIEPDIPPARVQLYLNMLGYGGTYGLDEDGLLGPASTAAIKEFQTTVGLPATGQPDRATTDQLTIEAGSQTYVVQDCNYGTAVQPGGIVLACSLARWVEIDWNTWTATGASGRGIYNTRSCDPSCVQSTDVHMDEVDVQLTDPQRWQCGDFRPYQLFTRIVFTDNDGYTWDEPIGDFYSC